MLTESSVTGTVFAPDGVPAANAKVEILCLSRGQEIEGMQFENPGRQPLAQVATDAAGKI